MELRLGSRLVGAGHPPFIVAEMSGNHNRSLQRALEIVDAAAGAGAHALKLQTYTAETMTLDIEERDFVVDDPENLWRGTSLFKLYREAHTPWAWHKRIFDRCRELGLVCFSTPFDETAVDFLETLDPPCYKIASFENVDIPLIRKAAATGKPLIISTGMATVAELDDAVHAARNGGCPSVVLLKCTSAYPSPPEGANLLTISHMRDLFDVEVGLSDHTMGIGAAVASVALGAAVIEKHFTLRRADGGVDAAFSMEPGEMKELSTECDRAWRALGKVSYGPSLAEMDSQKYRRSLYVVLDLKTGDVLTKDNVRAIRPGKGLPPKYYDLVLGKRVRREVRRGTPLGWELLFE